MVEVEDNCLSGLGILLGYCPVPQVSVFMYGMLGRNHILIKIDIADLIDETVDLTFRGGELLGYIRSFCLFILSLNVKRIMCSILFLRIIQIFSSELNITINNSKFIFPYFYNIAIIKVCKPFPILYEKFHLRVPAPLRLHLISIIE